MIPPLWLIFARSRGTKYGEFVELLPELVEFEFFEEHSWGNHARNRRSHGIVHLAVGSRRQNPFEYARSDGQKFQPADQFFPAVLDVDPVGINRIADVLLTASSRIW